MHVFIPVFFNAPLGGLQDHVLAQCKALIHSGHKSTVMCKPGPFSEKLMRAGISVLLNDFINIELAVRHAIEASPFDLVHAHPFASRSVGQKVAEKLEIPFIVTFHGKYLDAIHNWKNLVDVIICVSPAIRDNLVSKDFLPPFKIVVIPNGVDTAFYRGKLSENREETAQSSEIEFNTFRPRVAIVSRFDEDKKFIINLIKRTWEITKERRSYDIHWMVAGSGTLQNELQQSAETLNRAAGRELVSFYGWLDKQALAEFYNKADLCIGPGRCALEAMACSKPVIAIGSQGYVGLLEGERFQEGMHTNFGGFGSRNDSSTLEMMFHDIDRIIYDRDRMKRLGNNSCIFARTFFSQEILDKKLLILYTTMEKSASSSNSSARGLANA